MQRHERQQSSDCGSSTAVACWTTAWMALSVLHGSPDCCILAGAPALLVAALQERCTQSNSFWKHCMPCLTTWYFIFHVVL